MAPARAGRRPLMTPYAPMRNPSLTPEQARRVEQLYDDICLEPRQRQVALLAELCPDDLVVQLEVRWHLTTATQPTDATQTPGALNSVREALHAGLTEPFEASPTKQVEG